MGRLASEYAWALWLAAPLSITVVAALGFWWRGRNRSGPSVRAAISDHHRYLDTLAVSTSARGERLWVDSSATSGHGSPDGEEPGTGQIPGPGPVASGMAESGAHETPAIDSGAIASATKSLGAAS